MWNTGGNNGIAVEGANLNANEPFELRWVQRQDISGNPDVSLTASLTDSTAGTPVTNPVTLGPKGTGSVPGARPAWGLTYASTNTADGYVIYNMSVPTNGGSLGLWS